MVNVELGTVWITLVVRLTAGMEEITSPSTVASAVVLRVGDV